MAVDTRYPAPTANRAPATSFSPLPQPTTSASAPSSRIVAFRVANGAANTRRTISVGPFVGPAILKRIQWWCDNANANAGHALGFGTSLAAITETDVPLTTVKGWKELIERADSDVYAVDAGTIGFWQPNTAGALAIDRGDVNKVILDPSFFITITAYATAGAGNRWTGDLTVVENVSQQALANFL